MTPYKVEFHAKGDAETQGLPDEAFLALVQALTVAARDPWANSRPDDPGGDRALRWMPFDAGRGVAQFRVDDDRGLVRVYGVTWVG